MIERLQHFGEEFVACDHHFWVTLWLDSNLLRKISEPPTFCRASSVNNFLRGWNRQKYFSKKSKSLTLDIWYFSNIFRPLFTFCLFTQVVGKRRAKQRLEKMPISFKVELLRLRSENRIFILNCSNFHQSNSRKMNELPWEQERFCKIIHASLIFHEVIVKMLLFHFFSLLASWFKVEQQAELENSKSPSACQIGLKLATTFLPFSHFSHKPLKVSRPPTVCVCAETF